MTKRTIISQIKKLNRQYSGDYLKIDKAIKPLVDYVRKLGFYTFTSCSSHIRNYKNEPIFNGQAYVAFYYEDKDYDKVIELMNHEFPKSKYYRIYFSYIGENKVCMDIIFNTRYNRPHYLKKIYESLGIEVKGKLVLEKERECYGNTNSEKFTIYNQESTMK